MHFGRLFRFKNQHTQIWIIFLKVETFKKNYQKKKDFGMGVCSDLGKVGEVSINSLQDMKMQMCMEYINTSKT